MDLLNKMQYFFDNVFPENLTDNGENTDDDLKVFHKTVDLLSKKTNNFERVSKENLLTLLKSISLEDFTNVFNMFRYLTNTSKVNFEIYFLKKLEEANIISFTVKLQKKKDESSYNLGIEYNGVEISKPGFKTLIKMSKNDLRITESLIDFFIDRDLEKRLMMLRNIYGSKSWNILLNLIHSSQTRGASASRKGHIAEEITKNRLKEWGLIVNQDYNSSDVKLKDICNQKLHNLFQKNKINEKEYFEFISKLKNIKSLREVDIVIPLYDPYLIIQSAFYTSDTGGIAHSTVDQLVDEKKLSRSINLNFKFVGMVDGPGWVYLVTDLRKVLQHFDDFFQIRTLNVKLLNIIRDFLLVPIDIEILAGYYSNNLKKIVEMLSDIYTFSEEKIMYFVKKYSVFPYGYYKIENNTIKLTDPSRKQTIEKYYLFNCILSSKFQSGKFHVCGTDNIFFNESDLLKFGLNDKSVKIILDSLLKDFAIVEL